MDQMCTVEEPIFQNSLETGVTPRQNILEEHEDLFLIAFGNMLLHKRLRRERMVSPYAIPFRPATERSCTKMDRKVQKFQENHKIEKEDIASALQVQVENIALKEERTEIAKEWTEVTNGASVILKKNERN